MSNLTEAGRSFIPEDIEVPFDDIEIVTHENGASTAQLVHKGTVVWKRHLGVVYCGDTIRIGKVSGHVKIKVNID